MKILLALFILFTFALTTTAQDATGTPEAPAAESPEPSPFLRALSMIPNTAEVRASEPILSYADYRAAIESRGLPVPESLGAFLASDEPDIPLFPTLPQAGPNELLRNLVRGGPDFPITVGFDFFQIAQAVEFGLPPTAGKILIGDFDETIIRTVFALRGYTIERADESGTLLCPAAGCADGQRTNASGRNPANPFGGDLGRSEPVFVGENLLLNSPDDVLVESMIAAYQDSASSLADMPEFQALAHTLDAYPYLSAVTVFNPFPLTSLDPRVMTQNPEAGEALLAELEAAPLAPYLVTALASAADAEHEYGLALLVFANAGAAEQAAAVIDNRLETMKSVRTQQTYADILTEIGTLEPAQVVTDDATGLSVVVVRVTGDLPSNQQPDGTAERSHLPFQRLLQMVFMRDTNWLVWSAGE